MAAVALVFAAGHATAQDLTTPYSVSNTVAGQSSILAVPTSGVAGGAGQ